jgi:hypothetical protein
MTVLPIRVGGRAIAALLGLIGIAAVVTAMLVTAILLRAGPAGAATADRYWAYYLGHGSTWQYSTRGPATEYPVDGEVQGWRFAVQVDGGNALQPEATPSFSQLCASTSPKVGNIRVGIVLDFGATADAPAHEHPPASVVPGCVSVPTGSTGADVLQAAASVRIGTGADVGLVCGIDGYPATECAVAVATKPTAAPTHAPTPTPTQPSTPSPSPVPSAAAASPSAAASASPTPLTAAASDEPSTTAPAASSAPIVEHHRFPVLTVVGGALVVALGGGAAWRARAGRR